MQVRTIQFGWCCKSSLFPITYMFLPSGAARSLSRTRRRAPKSCLGLYPRTGDGSGEPARAWSLAWDMIVADPCNGFQPR